MINYSINNDIKKEFIEKVIFFGLIKLLDKNFHDVNITVKYKKMNSKYSTTYGRISVKNNDYKSLTLYINPIILDNEKQLINTIMHELTHVKQLYTRKLFFVNTVKNNRRKSVVYWQGRKLPKMSYSSLPYEKEANNTSDILSQKFNNYISK